MSEGAVRWNAPFDDHPARVASRRSMDAVARRAKDEWLDLYADDALIEDPVGPSPFDVQGDGYRGRERMSAFWDGMIAVTERIDFEITHSFAAGSEVANVGTITAYLPGDVHVQTDGVFVYHVTSDGLIDSLRAFWEVARAAGTMTSGDR